MDVDMRMPVITVKEGALFTNSRDVADFFEKRHNDVLRDIRVTIDKDPEWGVRNFAHTPYLHIQNGQTYTSYEITRDGFTMLAMGFTGDNAFAFKRRYIDKFNEMEAELRQRDEEDDVADLLGPEEFRLKVVAEGRRVHGTKAARELWFKFGLPVTPAMLAPPQQTLLTLF